jgi:hypothetical protein
MGFHGQDGRAVITPAEFGCIHWREKLRPISEPK